MESSSSTASLYHPVDQTKGGAREEVEQFTYDDGTGPIARTPARDLSRKHFEEWYLFVGDLVLTVIPTFFISKS
jgi:hypothetical protein